MSQQSKILKNNKDQQADKNPLFITPIKQNNSKLQYFYNSTTFKKVADQVKQKTQQKFKQIFNENGSYYVFRSQLKQINRVLPLYVPQQSPQLKKLYQIMLSNKQLRRTIQAKVKRNYILGMNLIKKVSPIQLIEKKLRQKKIELLKLMVKNKSTKILGEYALQLKRQNNNLSAIINYNYHILNDLNGRVYDLEAYKQNIERQCNLLNFNLQQQILINKQLIERQKYLKDIFMNQQNIHILNSKDIIYYMFLLGILSQQLYILSHQKKKQKSKEINKSNITNKVDIQTKLTDRTVIIECLNSNIVHFKLFTTIYMHAKSLIINNLSFIMNRISFFSEDFQKLYDYQQFSMNFERLIHKLMCNRNPISNYYKVSSEEKDSKTKKNLIIIAEKDHMNVIRWVLKDIMINESIMLNVQGCLFEVQLIEEGQKNDIQMMNQAYVLKIVLKDLDLNNYL